MARTLFRVGCGLLIALGCCQCGRESASTQRDAAPSEGAVTAVASSEPLLPAAGAPDISVDKLELGRRLFHETALSATSRKVSCATCHALERGGTTGRPPAEALGGETEPYDIPTVFNAAHQFAYFWNGRAQSLEAVIQTSIRAENVMDASWDEIIPALEGDASYSEAFERIYPEVGPTEDTITDALTGFVRSLSTRDAPFDRGLAGEELPPAVRDGYALFKQVGCARCHQGAGVGGNLFASFGSYIAARETIRNSDLGRYNVTNDEAHRYQFKVPSLRNVARTAPYLHDGSAPELTEVVRLMALHQCGRALSDDEAQSIVAFLESLTGNAPQSLAAGVQP